MTSLVSWLEPELQTGHVVRNMWGGVGWGGVGWVGVEEAGWGEMTRD